MRAFWNRLSLRLRLFLSFGVLFSVMTALTLILQSSFYAKSQVENLLEHELPSQLEHLGAQVALKLAPSLQVSRSLAGNSFIQRWIQRGMPEADLPLLAAEMAVVDQQLNAAAVFLAANDGQTIYYQHYKNGDFNRRQMQRSDEQDAWYFNYLASNLPYELNLDSNTFSGDKLQMFVNYTGNTLNANGEPVSVAGVALDMLQLAEIISGYRLGEHGRASLANKAGRVEVSADDALIADLGASAELQTLLNHEKVQVREITYENQQLFVGVVWLADLQRYLVVEVPRSDFMAPIEQQLYQSLLIGALLLLISLVLLYPLAVSLSRPLQRFQQQLVDITRTLNLSQRLETDDKAELGELAAQTNSLLERLAFAISGVQRSSSRLTTTASNLACTAGLVSRNTDRQQEVSQSMAAAVEEMSSSVAEITSTMEELSASSTQIADHSQSVVDVANLTLESSKKGATAMQLLQLRMADIHQDSENSLQEIVQLGRKSKEISKVMDLINNLADQTKLIAFNAALEASSAGESGKRFSVVASEIRRLADSVTDSTNEIEDRIQEIQDSINRLVITSEKGASSIQLGMQVSLETAEDLNSLVQAASKTSSAAQQISLSTRQQKTASSQVVIALRDIANASMHNAQSVRHITEISEEMINMSADLSYLVREFHLDEPEKIEALSTLANKQEV
ncbi:MAG: methyl-accepting chemotaxis protein [Pseudomonas sp.]|nr:methyl-accepting chemotaxis protein [Pseudomonas sp.]